MKDGQEKLIFPPTMYWEQVCKNCPKAATDYITLWRLPQKKNRIFIPFDKVREVFCNSRQSFSHNLLSLVKEGLVSSHPCEQGFLIELVNWDYDDNTLTP